MIFSFFANSYYFVVNSHRGRSFGQGAYIRERGGGGGGSNTILTPLRGVILKNRGVGVGVSRLIWAVLSKDPGGLVLDLANFPAVL